MSPTSPAQDAAEPISNPPLVDFDFLHRRAESGTPGWHGNVRVAADDDPDLESFSKLKSTTWSVPLRFEHIRRLLLGFLPQDMDDRWFIYSRGPDASDDAQGGEGGRAMVHFHRSWTGFPNMSVELVVDDPVAMLSALAETAGTGASGAVPAGEFAGRITSLTWETDEGRVCFGDGGPADWVRGLCRSLFGFEMSADAPSVPEEKRVAKKK